ncbi:MAG: aminotransferase class III-fold pyridoxal phosphate-dependent enzyme [Bacteroidota bacterium]
MTSLRETFLKHVAQTSELPMMLEIEKAEGVWLYSPDGQKYLDLISGISVSSMGHCDPDVVAAVREQAGKYMHTMVYGEYLMSPQVELAELLVNQLPNRLNSVYFCNSGSEATEGAMKLAKRVTDRTEIIACRNAYHGSTHGSMSIMSDTYFTQAYRPLLPNVRFIDFNDDEQLAQISKKTACVVAETIQAEAGVILPENGYLKKLRKRCDGTGALLVLDEIQVGYGRSGTLFAFEQFAVEPDILLLAKAMGGGMPIGAFVSDKALLDQFRVNPILGHITTFGGHPVVCAAALATLRKLVETDLVARVNEKSDLFRSLLVHPAIKEIRGHGFLLAVDVGDFDRLQAVIAGAKELGIIIDWFLFQNTSFRIAPPLVISEEEIRYACKQLLTVLDRVYRK